MNYFSFESRWISDGIGEEYKTWKPNPKNNSFTSSPRIFIESPTGTGKTSFIINKLLPYAATEGKHILYLGNRTALEKQTQNAAEKNLIPIRNFEIFTFSRKPDVANIYKYPNSSSTITILNYQAVLGFLKSPLYKSSLEPFDYIVLDEAHFFWKMQYLMQ